MDVQVQTKIGENQVPKFEIILICPLHSKSIVTFPIEALSPQEAEGKAIGEKAHCKMPPGHTFVIHAVDVVGTQPIVERVPREMPEKYVPPWPESLYFIDSKTVAERVKRREWWKTT